MVDLTEVRLVVSFFHGAKALVSYQSTTVNVTSLAWYLIVMHVVDFSAL